MTANWRHPRGHLYLLDTGPYRRGARHSAGNVDPDPQAHPICFALIFAQTASSRLANVLLKMNAADRVWGRVLFVSEKTHWPGRLAMSCGCWCWLECTFVSLFTERPDCQPIDATSQHHSQTNTEVSSSSSHPVPERCRRARASGGWPRACLSIGLCALPTN